MERKIQKTVNTGGLSEFVCSIWVYRVMAQRDRLATCLQLAFRRKHILTLILDF